MNAEERRARRDRRVFLERMAFAAGAAPMIAGGALSVGCGPGGPDDDSVAVPLADLAPGARTVVVWREQPVEVLRQADGVRVLSLLCTHFSCRVRWEESAGEYVCPCHDGRFDADGRPIAGPPDAPLRAIPFVVEEGMVRIGLVHGTIAGEG
jgi:Rieske Fe-S protein